MASFALVPIEFITEGDNVGVFTGVHCTTGKPAEARYAHVWTVLGGKITRFRQYIDMQAIANARRP